MMSATRLKRSLRQNKIPNYREVLRANLSSSFTDQNEPVTSSRKTRVTRKPSVLAERNRSVLSESDPDYSLSESADDSDDGLFSKKMKVDGASHAEHMRKASITLKRVSVSKPATPSRLDKSVDFAGILSAADDEDDGNEYRRERQKQLLDRQMVLNSIGFDDGLEEFKTIAKSKPKEEPDEKVAKPAVKRPYVKREIVSSRRRSERLQSQSIDLSIDNVDDDSGLRRSSRLNAVSIISYDEGGDSESVEIDENLNLQSEEDRKFLEGLKDAINVSCDSVSDFTTGDFDKFKETLKTCYMFGEPKKVIASRIFSMDFHPSEQKLLLLVGDAYGNVALRDLATHDGVKIKGHQSHTNCVKFSLQEKSKFYSAGLDGTIRIGDINDSSFNLLYSSESHTSWLHESGNTLYIAEGNGCVRLLDLRSPNNNPPSFRCHGRSVRTVQTNPSDENYFLTSSGTCYFGVWDVRYIEAVKPEPIILKHTTYALTSAFYSAKGNHILTTGNDDTVRVFDVTDNINNLKEISRISHTNHTGRYLTDFKATWQPNREDCFYIGSMMKPRRIQAYTETGLPIREFRSDSMLTVNSVISVHPTLPIIVGGNGAGKIHTFSPFRNLSDI